MSFIFKSPFVRLSIHLKPHEERVLGGLLVVTPATVAHFENGAFTTEDPEIAALIRRSPSFKQGSVVEITADMEEMFDQGQKQGVHRGALSTQDLHTEAGTKAEKSKAGPICDYPGCGKEFPDDLAGKKFAAHKIAHRMAENRLRDKPKIEEQ